MLQPSTFNNNLLEWYHSNKRDLPWRKTEDPYKIWLSEVMLQQTQVITVIPYFEKFITKYPTLSDLADADEQSLLKDWEGLGYYNRIRNFHSAVQEVKEDYGGRAPEDPGEFFKLKGVGPYIGGAVQSIAFNHLLAAVDGNVLRVMARLNADVRDTTKASVQRSVKEEIESMIPLEAGDFNQALMELGATICTPRTPKCIVCPVQEHCEAFRDNTVHDYPVKKKKPRKKEEYYNVYFIVNDREEIIVLRQFVHPLKQVTLLPVEIDLVPVVHDEEYYNVYFIVNDREEIYLYRQEGDLLKGMYELPKYDVDTSLENIESELDVELDQKKVYIGSDKHVFTHKVWYMESYLLHTTSSNEHFMPLDEVSHRSEEHTSELLS